MILGRGLRKPYVACVACELAAFERPDDCIAITDLTQPSRPKAVFTGDTLFVGDVGRPDLSGDRTPQELAAMLYSSLHDKLLNLPDETEIFPAHGAGSLCGRQMGTERSSTIGKERRTNYALQAPNCDEFIRLLTDGLPPRRPGLQRGPRAR